MENKPKKFRLHASKLFLTYPQCSLERVEVHKHLEQKFKDNMKEYMIVQESHKDGEKHIHCYIELNKRVDLNSDKCLDILEYHGNYQSCKSKEKTIEYLIKEDKEPLQSMDFKHWLSQSRNHKKIENNLEKLKMVEELGLAQCVRTGQIALTNLPLYEKAVNILKNLEMKDEREELPTRLETPWNFSLKFDLDLKKCHYWIYSKKSNYGKTTFAQQLCKQYRTQVWNTEEKYQPHITATTEMIIFDEYSQRTCLTISLLNMIMDGTVFITAKGVNAWQLQNKPLVIVLANFSPLEIYSKSPNLPNLLSRIEIINLEDNHPGF